jgi:hypothetical protein
MAKKESKILNLNEQNLPGASSAIDFDESTVNVTLDQELIESLEKEVEDKKRENREKLYAISMNSSLLIRYEDFIKNEVEWNSTEALGVIEINKQIQKIKGEKIKDNVIYMGALPIEATHYFLNKVKGTGVQDATDFINLYRAFDTVLKDVKVYNQMVQELEKKLAAAMQGISLG